MFANENEREIDNESFVEFKESNVTYYIEKGD